MSREFAKGEDRRTFLQTLAAAGVIGSTGVGGALAQSEADAYHQQLSSHLQDEEDLPEGEFVYGITEQAAIDTFALEGAGSGSESQFPVDSGDVPITTADRIAVNESPSNPYDYTYQGFVEDRSLEQGDVLLAVANIRSETSGAETQAQFKYRYTDPNGETVFQSGSFVQESSTVQPTGEWARFFFPIEVGEKPEGTDHTPYLEFWTGQGEQTIEFGGMALLDYSDEDVAAGDLPAGAPGRRNPLLDYEGREEGAQWRQDARDRIQDIRTTDTEVEVVDADGNAVPEATVDVSMVEHEFDFGSAVSVNNINGDSEDQEQYREIFLDNFNKAVIENGLKYPSFLGPWGDSKEGAIEALEWLDDQGVETRGHYLVWEEYTNDGGGGMAIENPGDYTDAELQQLMLDRITNHAESVGDLVTEWDMHNHPIWQPNIREPEGRLTWEQVLEWWEAGDGATDAELYTNEMNNVAGDSYATDHLNLVQRLIDDGAAIDGVGFMGHVQFPGGAVSTPEEILSTYDDFAETGLPILITEFDVQIADTRPDVQIDWQADYLRDFLIAAFSHEAVEGVMSWGFWAEDHWRPTGAYYDADWNIRPHGEKYLDLVFDQWWTEESGTADSNGVYTFNGFEGEYEIRASDGSRIGETTANIAEDGTIEVRITPASIADVDLGVDSHTLWNDETVELDVTATNESGAELILPDDVVSFESSAPEAVAVSDDGEVSVAGTGAGTVTVTVEAYGDTAVATARFATFGEPSIIDPAEDFSMVASQSGLELASGQGNYDDSSRFRNVDASTPGTLTYNVEDGIAAFRAITIVNFQEFDGDGDVYEGLTFEVSADGSSWETVDAERTTLESAGDANGYFAKRQYRVTGGVPADATYLRITISESQANWSVNLAEVGIWASTTNVSDGDQTGPVLLFDDVQAGDTYEAPHPAAVSIVDDQSDVTEQSVTLNGEAFEGGQLRARGRNVLAASATSGGGVTTDAALEFEVVDDEHDLKARMNVGETEATVGDRLTFRVQDTTGNDHWISDLQWDFDDGSSGDGWWQSHRFAEPGAYTVELTATDESGNETTDRVVVWVADLESTLAEIRPSTTEAGVDERVEFRVEDTTGQGRWIDDLAWDLGDSTTAEGWFAAHSYDESGTYTVTLTATDQLGYSTSDEVEIAVE